MVLTMWARRILQAIGPAASVGLVGCAEVTTAMPPAPDPSVEHFAVVQAELEAPCMAGSIEACMELGRAGLNTNLGAGLPWLMRACELEPQACVAVGDALIGRRANASDPTVAAHAYRVACEADHRGACYELAVLHYLGLGVELDDPLTARLHHAACEGGIPEGCAYLGHLYDRGFGVRRSATLASHYRDLACRRGFDDLCGTRVGTSRARAESPAAPVNQAGATAAGEAPAQTEPRQQPKRKKSFKPTGASSSED
jgi:hypothetical protein